MASHLSFVEFVVEQIQNAGVIRYRKMFGEYALYCNNKVVALICDDQLFIKPTKAGETFIGKPVMAPPYPGAKPSFLIEEQIEDKEWLCDLVKLTEKEIPMPKQKKSKKKNRGKTK